MTNTNEANPMSKLITLTVDAAASTVEVIAADALGYGVNVTQGRYTEVTLDPESAKSVAAALRTAGIQVW